MRIALAFLAVSLMVVCVTGVRAQAISSAEAPAPLVGDTWKYRTVDVWTGKETSQYETQLVEIQSERFVLRTKDTTSKESFTIYQGRDLSACRKMKNDETVVCKGPYRFPLKVGDAYSFEKLPYSNGNGYFSESCKVAGSESLTVAAGTFETLRIECDGTWTNVVGGTNTGRVVEVLWYAPAVNRSVKSTFVTRTSGGQIDARYQTELVQFMRP